MHVITQICVLFLWMHTVTFVTSQDCTLEEFLNSPLYDSNFDTTELESSYAPGKQVRVGCKVGFSGFFILTCVEGGWHSRGEKCTPIKCQVNQLEGTRFDPPYKNLFLPGETVRVICDEKYWVSTPQEVSAVSTCQENGEWTFRPICRELLGCEPPPVLDHGDVKYTMKSQYNHNEMVEYMCQLYHTMEGEPNRICINGEWTGHMRCLEPCTLNEDDTRQHNITLKLSDKKFFLHDEIMQFECAHGVPVGNMAMRQRCNSGVVLLPTCQ